MREIKLKVNNDKSEVLLCSSESKSSDVDISNVTLYGTTIVISNIKQKKNRGYIRQHFFY